MFILLLAETLAFGTYKVAKVETSLSGYKISLVFAGNETFYGN
jgi:hypothetical protein